MNLNEIANKVPHFRTTIAGTLLIVGSLASFLGQWISTGMPEAQSWTILGAALTTGSGLIASADAKIVDSTQKT